MESGETGAGYNTLSHSQTSAAGEIQSLLPSPPTTQSSESQHQPLASDSPALSSQSGGALASPAALSSEELLMGLQTPSTGHNVITVNM